MQVLRTDDVSDGINMLKLRLTSRITVDLSAVLLDTCILLIGIPPLGKCQRKNINVTTSRSFQKAIFITNLYLYSLVITLLFIAPSPRSPEVDLWQSRAPSKLPRSEFKHTERCTNPPADAP